MASYPTFDALAGDQEYPTGCAAAQFPGGLLTISPVTDFTGGLHFTYTAATRIYALDGDGISLSFGPADYNPPSADIGVWTRGGDLLTLEALTWGGTRMAYNRIVYVNATKDGIPVAYACITGVPTLALDVPASGVAEYPDAGTDAFAHTLISGNVIAYGFKQATVSFQADFTAKRVSITVHLLATTTGPEPHAVVDLGIMTGSGAIDPATGRFSGSWSSADRDINGTFSGSFFGPQAQEFGLAFSVSGRDGSGTPVFASHGAINGSR